MKAQRRGSIRDPPLPAVDGQFRQPTDVAWDPQGNIFISDGYINSRVAKYDKNGDWVKQWGERGSEARRIQHAAQHRGGLPRATSMWRIAATAAFRCSIRDGVYLREITIDVPVPPDAHPWMGESSRSTEAAGRCRTARPGLSALRRGRRSTFSLPMRFRGGSTSFRWTARCLVCWAARGRQTKEFGWIHEMACPSDNTIYVAEFLNWRVQKLILH